MNKVDFFDVDKNPIIYLNKLSTTYKSGTWTNCDNNPSNKNCHDRKIDSMVKFKEYKTIVENKLVEINLDSESCKNLDNSKAKKKIEEMWSLVDSLEVNHRLFKKQYDELIFSPNEVINVDENINKFRYLELDRKLEKYDKKTYALYKNFFYIMLITSGIFFIRKQLKK